MRPMEKGERLTAAVTGGLLPRSERVRAGGLELHCLLWGADGDPAVLLVHGNGGHAHWWDPLVPHLVPGFRLIAPDLRGHGESDWPQQPDYHIEDYVADLAAIADALAPRRFAIVGHSMGARAATWFAAHQTERVRGLALLDTTMRGVDPETAQRWRGHMVGQRQGRGYPSRAAACAAFRFVPAEADVDAAIIADLAHHAVRERGPGDWTFRFDRAVLSVEGDRGGDLTAALLALPCPLWVGRGTGSLVVPRREFERVRRQRPDLELCDFAGAHHFFLADPRGAGAALRTFLARLPA
jgi:pimeloyl-ACP methyl ester carboxylesterase